MSNQANPPPRRLTFSWPQASKSLVYLVRVWPREERSVVRPSKREKRGSGILVEQNHDYRKAANRFFLNLTPSL
jgi:hypothetical protein